MLYKVTLTFEYEDVFLNGGHSNESYWGVPYYCVPRLTFVVLNLIGIQRANQEIRDSHPCKALGRKHIFFSA